MERAMLHAPILMIVLILAIQFFPASASEQAEVLFDFGDGSYRWSEGDLGAARDAFNVTLDAASHLQINVGYEWFSFGVMINDIWGYRQSGPVWWHLYTWNHDRETWDMPPLGAASLMLEPGDRIAWLFAVDDPVTFKSPVPSPTPMHPFPSLQFRGDNLNTGNHPGELCDEPSLDWQFNTGAFEISGSVAVSGGTVFVPTWTGLFALDENDGSVLWSRADIAGMSSPSLFDGGLFIGSRAGRLHRVSALTGKDIWNVSLIASPQFTGIASSPKYDLGRVYVGLFNESGGDGGVVALDARNGMEVWRHVSPSVHMSSPAVFDDKLYIGLAGLFNTSTLTFNPPYGILALNASTGSEVWFNQTSGPVFSSPMYSGNRVYYTSRDGYLGMAGFGKRPIGRSTSSPADSATGNWPWRLMFVGDGIIGEQGHVRAFHGNLDELWNVTLPGPVQSSPLHVGGHVIVTTNSPQGTVYILDAHSGNILWSFAPAPEDYILSSPVVADGRLFVASDNGIVYSLSCPAIGGTTTMSIFGLTGFVVLTAIITVSVAAIVYPLRRKGQ